MNPEQAPVQRQPGGRKARHVAKGKSERLSQRKRGKAGKRPSGYRGGYGSRMG